MSADVVVVGAGLAGLACAHDLARHGLDVQVLEAGDAVGGRVRSDRVDGFTLDRGFQVLNTAYPALLAVLGPDGMAALDVRAFDPMVRIRRHDELVELGNPLQRPTSLGSAVRLPVGGVAGKAAAGLYAGACVAGPAQTLMHREDVSSADAWRRARIPDEIVDAVLRPFFSGVVLETGMTTSRRFTDLMMRMFARGRSTVPAGGMQRLPEQIAASLPPGTVRLSTPVQEVGTRKVHTDAGEVSARAVVVATDPWTAAELLPVLEPASRPHGVTTVYHAAPAFPEAAGMLLLDADRSPVSNSIALSEAAPEYAPSGRVLVATSMVHGSGLPDPDGPEVRSVLAALHRTDTSSWEQVATYDLPRALPGMPAPHPLRKPVRLGDGRYVAGDHLDTSSIQGALVSGRRAARAVVHDLLGG